LDEWTITTRKGAPGYGNHDSRNSTISHEEDIK
jgi:hypothetical protein